MQVIVKSLAQAALASKGSTNVQYHMFRRVNNVHTVLFGDSEVPARDWKNLGWCLLELPEETLNLQGLPAH
jgi:hypothetical protein